MSKGRKTRLFAILLSLAMLLGSVPVLAAERPTKPSNPTWGDLFDLIAYMEAETEGAAWYSEDEWNHALHNWEPEGKKLVHQEKGDELSEKGEEWFWSVVPGDMTPDMKLAGVSLEHYSDYYELTMQFIDSMEIAIGEYYWGDDVDAELWAVEKAYADFWERADELGEITVIGDDEEPLEGQEWIYYSALEQLRKEHDNIYDNHWPKTDEAWDYVTREQCLELITMLRTALNNLNTAQESGKGSFTLDIPGETPQTPDGGTSQTPNTETSSSDSASTEAPAVAAPVVTSATTSTVNGEKSTVEGVYLIKKVDGVAFTAPLADIAAGYGIASGEKAYAMVWDLNPKKSYLAQQVIDNAAASIGAEVGPALNIELGKKNAAGKYSLLSQNGSAITIKIGVPASFAQEGKAYAVVCVRPGGAVSIMADQDTDANTVTFTTTGGAGAYAIVKY